MESMLILKFENINQMVRCENRKCPGMLGSDEPIQRAYGWGHVNDIGWTFKKADLWNGEKASPFNKDLRFSDSTFAEIYCPICSKLKNKTGEKNGI